MPCLLIALRWLASRDSCQGFSRRFSLEDIRSKRRDPVIGENVSDFRLGRGGTRYFLPANGRLHVLPLRVVLRPKLPPSLMRVGEAALLGCQRHQQKKARERVPGNHQFRDDLEIVANLLQKLAPAGGASRLKGPPLK